MVRLPIAPRTLKAVREPCRAFLEDKLGLTLNMEKTHNTHVNDGFIGACQEFCV